jgi:hypothetical protein
MWGSPVGLAGNHAHQGGHAAMTVTFIQLGLVFGQGHDLQLGKCRAQ